MNEDRFEHDNNPKIDDDYVPTRTVILAALFWVGGPVIVSVSIVATLVYHYLNP